jgi:hypothetical protein
MKIALEYRTIKAAKRNDHRNPITAAFHHLEHGIKESKHELTTVEEADVVFVFGSITERKTQTERYLVIDALRKSGKHILSIDSGLFGTYIRQATANPESNFFRVVYGDCTGEGDILFENMPSERLDWFQQSYNFKIKEPKGDTGDILFIGQSEKGWQYNNLEPFYEWAKKSLQEIRYNTDRKIIYRVHPTDSTNIKSLVNDVDNLHMTIGNRNRVGIIDDLKNTTTSVTHSSSAALESLVEGNHTIALDDRCIVAKACARSITDQMPWQDRQQHLQDFAYCTWHISEFANPKLIETYINLIKDKK